MFLYFAPKEQEFLANFKVVAVVLKAFWRHLKMFFGHWQLYTHFQSSPWTLLFSEEFLLRHLMLTYELFKHKKNTSNSKGCVVSKHNRQLSKEPSLNCIFRICYKQLVAKMHNLFPCLWIYEKYHIPHAMASGKCLIGNGFDFQFDNDLKHAANSVKAYLDRKHTVANSGMSQEVWRRFLRGFGLSKRGGHWFSTASLEMYKLCFYLMFCISMYICTWLDDSLHICPIFLAKNLKKWGVAQALCTVLYL